MYSVFLPQNIPQQQEECIFGRRTEVLSIDCDLEERRAEMKEINQRNCLPITICTHARTH